MPRDGSRSSGKQRRHVFGFREKDGLNPCPSTRPQPSQPLDEPFLTGVFFTNRLEAAGEIGERSVFAGDGVEIEQKIPGAVVAGRVAPLDFVLDVPPDGRALPPQAVEAYAAC